MVKVFNVTSTKWSRLALEKSCFFLFFFFFHTTQRWRKPPRFTHVNNIFWWAAFLPHRHQNPHIENWHIFIATKEHTLRVPLQKVSPGCRLFNTSSYYTIPEKASVHLTKEMLAFKWPYKFATPDRWDKQPTSLNTHCVLWQHLMLTWSVGDS